MSVVSERKNSWSSGEFNQFMSNKTLPEQLVFAFNDYEDYIGSTYQKHVRLTRLHGILAEALSNPVALIYPPARLNGSEPVSPLNSNRFAIQRALTDLEKVQKPDNMEGQLKITPKTLKKCLQAIKEYNFSYSVLTP